MARAAAARGPTRPRRRSGRLRWRSCADTTHGAPSQLVVHHECASGEAGSLEEVLRVASAGKRVRVDTDATGRGAELDDEIGDRLPHSHCPCFSFYEQVADHTEAGAVAQRLDLDR